MNLSEFLDPNNELHQIQVIAPTFTYGTMYGMKSKYDFEIDFDEYATSIEWEFNVLVGGKIIATFNTIDETKEYIEMVDYNLDN